MKNIDKWRPTKFVFRDNRLRASLDPKEISPASRLIADLVAANYQEYLGQHARGRLVDLGCGKVPLWGAYKDFITEAICVDWDNSLHASEFLDFTCDLSKPLPIPDEWCDTIVLSDVLEHIPNPEVIWSEMARILRPEGKILLNVPFYYWPHEGPHDYYRYTVFALRRFALLAKLSVVLDKPIGGVPEILADLLGKNAVRFTGGVRLAGMLQTFIGWFVRTRWGRSISENTASSFPLGYFMVVQKPPLTRT